MDDKEKRSYLSESIVRIPVATAVMVVPENQRRIALFFVATGGATIGTRPQLLSSGENGGFPGANTTPTVPSGMLSRKLHGAFVTSAWYAINNSAVDFIQFIEALEE